MWSWNVPVLILGMAIGFGIYRIVIVGIKGWNIKRNEIQYIYREIRIEVY